jgi:hypothetical protein
MKDGRAMARSVSRLILTAEAPVRAWVSPCSICSGQSGTEMRFSPSFSEFPCKYYSTVTAHTDSIYHRGMNSRPVVARISEI